MNTEQLTALRERADSNQCDRKDGQLKVKLIGEFSFSYPLQCSACYFHRPQPDCEVCQGQVEYTITPNVPWTTIKEILAASGWDQMASDIQQWREYAEELEAEIYRLRKQNIVDAGAYIP